MVVSINIDETVLRPNVRPAKPKSKRGTITFIADIDERYGPNTKRNLTRGVNETDDPYVRPKEDRPLSVETPVMELEAYRLSIEAGGGGLLPLELSTPPVEGEEPQDDTFAVGSFSIGLAFALPGDMVTTPDDPSPL